jgi:hypothetical protein
MLIDTPGFADTSKEDEDIANLIVLKLAQYEYVNQILITLNGT